MSTIMLYNSIAKHNLNDSNIIIRTEIVHYFVDLDTAAY